MTLQIPLNWTLNQNTEQTYCLSISLSFISSTRSFRNKNQSDLICRSITKHNNPHLVYFQLCFVQECLSIIQVDVLNCNMLYNRPVYLCATPVLNLLWHLSMTKPWWWYPACEYHWRSSQPKNSRRVSLNPVPEFHSNFNVKQSGDSPAAHNLQIYTWTFPRHRRSGRL